MFVLRSRRALSLQRRLIHLSAMAESSSQPAADLLIERHKEEPSLPAESISKELILTAAPEGPELDVGAEAARSNGDAGSPLPVEVLKEEATPPESSLSSENGTVTTVTIEEDTLSALLRHIKTEGGQGRGGEPGKRPDQVQDQQSESHFKRQATPFEARLTF